MKKLSIFIIGFTMSLAFSGCSGMLDEMIPKDAIPQSELSDSDMEKLINGVYADMEEFVFDFYMDGDVKGENFKAGPGFSLNDPMLMAPSTSEVLDKWQKAYTTLKQVNFLVETYETLENKETSIAKKAGGTAYYFRALIYYNLVIRWGGVPILKKRTYDTVPISPETDVWNFITEDLSNAEALLSDFTDKYYVSLAACNALQARVFLSLERYDEAIQYADKVINNANFTLSTSSVEYADMFIYNSNSKELILTLANKRTSSLLLFYQKINDIDPTWDYSPADDCYESLYANTSEKEGDLRRPAVFNEDNSRILKIPNGSDGQFVVNEQPSQTPIIVARLSEMYLIKAEALGNVSGLGVLRDFMSHRYEKINLPTSMNETDFQNQILDERHREFYAEGQRWYDLKRTNRLDLIKSLNGRDYLMYFPIPQTEIDLAGTENYPQNPGY